MDPVCLGGLCAWSRRGLGLLQALALALERAPLSGRSGQGTDRDCGCRCVIMWMRFWVANRAMRARQYVLRASINKTQRCQKGSATVTAMMAAVGGGQAGVAKFQNQMPAVASRGTLSFLVRLAT